MGDSNTIRIVAGDSSAGAIAGTVSVHLAELSGGFMTSLGPRFLRRVFTNIATSNHGISIVAFDGDVVVGFLLGTTDTGGLYRDFVRRYGLSAGVLALPKMLTPAGLRRLFETLRYPGRDDGDWDVPAELLDMAVVEECKGTGLANRLFDHFCEELRKRGVREFKITTGADLKRAHRFYEKRGAVRVGCIEIHTGESTLVYRYDLGDR